MARGEIYEIPSEVSHPGEPPTKRNSQLEKEEIYDNPITNDLKDDVMEEDEAFESSGPEDANEPTMDIFS
ncbi:Protein CBG21141 [Caenorhabditis briggsae]|uniref:Protein CBG21141 n=1 Tax=Caenorhabditis briggsae TaxID=6238 RepID=A8XZE2_CAEBR|nr:Protein CBG21141 [Caenorhabditis briggsae]CAP38069.2 Protein CBG21141 [Caenorhabditis briggsae]